MKHRNLEILREHYINVPDFIVVDGKEELDLSFSKEVSCDESEYRFFKRGIVCSPLLF